MERLEGPLHRIPHYTQVTLARCCPCVGGCSPLGGSAAEGPILSRFFSACSLSRQRAALVDLSTPLKLHLEFAEHVNKGGLHVFDSQVSFLKPSAQLAVVRIGYRFSLGCRRTRSVFNEFTVQKRHDQRERQHQRQN